MSDPNEQPTWWEKTRLVLFGPPRDLQDKSLFHRLSLIPILAWIGLGADGLSSSSYGPDEAFRTLGEHTYLCVALAAATAVTVFVIAAGYSRMIERFPHGGGGYIVATTLLGPRIGVISGCALLVDYILTVTVSLAAAGEALFSFIPRDWHTFALPCDIAFICILVVLNIRGVRESVLAMSPIFLLFAVSHLVVIVGGLTAHAGEIGHTVHQVREGFSGGLSTLGLGGMLLLGLHAYSLGGGTYTGIEAVSNGLPILREPRVHSGKRTMLYMSTSLAFTAGGLLLLYLLWNIRPQEGMTMNAVLLQKMTEGLPGGQAMAFITLFSEAALLVVAAQAGFVDGPRVLANMALDSWMPRHFATLSNRLTTQNGILLMGAAGLGLLLYTKGDVRQLVVLYSINVFLTFSLSMFGMLRRAIKAPRQEVGRRRELVLFTVAFVLCATILVVTTIEKFHEGGWLTLLITGGLVLGCFGVRRHYQALATKLRDLFVELERLSHHAHGTAGEVNRAEPTAAVLVGSYGGLGIHTLMNLFRAFPGQYKNVVFLGVGVLDSAAYHDEHSMDRIREQMEQALARFVDLSRRLGLPATSRYAIGTDVVEEAEQLCLSVAKDFPRTTFFAGKIIFQRESWYQPLLHNETALALQKRLHWAGHVLVIMPAKVQ